MVTRRTVIAGSAGIGTAAVFGGGAVAVASGSDAPASRSGHIVGATAITRVYGEGQKLIAVAVEYDHDIADSSLSTSSFAVADRTVTKVYANRTAALADRGRDGRYVVVELSPDDKAALLWGKDAVGASPSPTASTSASASASAEPSPSGSSGTNPGTGGPTAGDTTPGGPIVPAQATVTQTGTISTSRGARFPASGTAVATSAVVNLIVDDFRQFTFEDPATGRTLKYNLFVPKGYDPRRKYPLVLFMHDASVVNVDTVGPLVQGLGAVCWASPEDQARHESFVLAPEYGEVVIDDNYKPTTLFETTAHLVEAVTEKYAIDPKRRYTTGQSMGAMLSLGLNIRYPDLFAAAYIVAGQWPDSEAAPLAQKKLWILVAQDDTKAYPGENAITKVIEAAGTKVGTAVWDAGSTATQFAADVRNLKKQQAPVNYAAFQTGTVTATTGATSPHMGTWQIAYSIPGIREWLMKQSL
ncbi:alpha/beta hydrolase-fold protein [Streptomyces cylindrosporus]|uniref:Acyl-CoA:diacylglycerol acyltransferase n=1 Tax=Streptomyces cylindrosporus TaxID=2927583 RepID=A0ABS9YN28_9ACTN|nr:alpha/beta hydrolase-fold protein [Streptomyces cylindrosporus]MCI3277960.1 alpha/beta hydrolase-fold protein [Streptomyces cylindrosporus]